LEKDSKILRRGRETISKEPLSAKGGAEERKRRTPFYRYGKNSGERERKGGVFSSVSGEKN